MATTVPARPATPELGKSPTMIFATPVFGNVPATPAAAPIPAQDPVAVQARMRQQAQMIDQILNDEDLQANLDNIIARNGVFLHLNFRPNIKPEDALWESQYAYFQQEIATKSIQDIMDQNFMLWQQNLFMPPLVSGARLELQDIKTTQYKEAFATGNFSNGTVNDNFMTKMTMMYFGLPIEPFTMHNIMHPEDEGTHPPDPPPLPAHVQRIMYAEAPLEFLDGYNSRSYGYPSLRSKFLSLFRFDIF